jgi:hypothetical protein
LVERDGAVHLLWRGRAVNPGWQLHFKGGLAMLTDLENSVALTDHRESIEPLFEKCAGCHGDVYEFDPVVNDNRYCPDCYGELAKEDEDGN